MTAPPRGARDDRGFTLVELAVSMTLLSVVITLLYSALWYALRSWNAVERQRDAAHTYALVQGVLAQQLRQARPLFVADARGQRRLAFAGAADRLSYVAPLSRRDDTLYLNTLLLDHGSAGATLRLRYAPFHAGQDAVETITDAAADAMSVELMTPVDALDIAYYGVPDAGVAPVWSSTWNDARALPERIRIRIRIATPATAARGWPDLLVCPGGGAGCLMPAGGVRGLRSARAGVTIHGG